MVVGGWINPLQTLSQGPLLTFCKLVVRVNQDVREDPELDNKGDLFDPLELHTIDIELVFCQHQFLPPSDTPLRIFLRFRKSR